MNTGRLTEAMFDAVVARLAEALAVAEPAADQRVTSAANARKAVEHLVADLVALEQQLVPCAGKREQPAVRAAAVRSRPVLGC